MSTVADRSAPSDHRCYPADFQLQDGIYRPTAGLDRFHYNDGDAVEEYMQAALATTQDRTAGSPELETKIRDWTTLYHFSQLRANILRPFALESRRRVLDIGCGCGAITRYLGETCEHVTAVEGSFRRLRMARERCAGLSNIDFVCSDFLQTRFAEVYDLVTLVGVLEYSAVFDPARPDPWKALLERVSGLLSPDGAILIAIENQLGLKYFAGDPEDHTGRRFEGIEGYYPGTRARTFGMNALRELLQQAGLSAQFYLPLPDYKLPRAILQATATEEGLRLGQWYDGCPAGRGDAFVDPLVQVELERNGLMGHMANSFLVWATRTPAPPANWKAAVYTYGRRPCYQTETKLLLEGDQLRVVKRPLHPSARPPATASLSHNLQSASYKKGEKLSLAMLRALRTDGTSGLEEFGRLMKAWMGYLQQNSAPPGGSHGILPPEFADCTPFNLIANVGQLAYIDQEWSYQHAPVTVDWVLFRGLYCLLFAYSPVMIQVERVGTWRRFMMLAFRQAGLELTDAQLKALALRDIAFRNQVLPDGPYWQVTWEGYARELDASRVDRLDRIREKLTRVRSTAGRIFRRVTRILRPRSRR